VLFRSKTPGYPTLEEAREAGLFHPNCRHAYGLYLDIDAEIRREELGAGENHQAGREALRDNIRSLDADHIDVGNARIWLDPALLAHHKPEALVREALTRAQQHANFDGVEILNVLRIQRGEPGVNAFVAPDETADRIYLLASDVRGFAQMEAARIESMYKVLKVNRPPDATKRAGDAIEYTARILLHELGHIIHKRSGQDILRAVDLSLKQYALEVIKVGVMYGGPPDWVDVTILAECVAEDFRLLVDPKSVYPHAHTAEFDLLYPAAAHARRQMLKAAIKW